MFYIFETANNHMGNVKHGKRIIHEFNKLAEKHYCEAAHCLYAGRLDLIKDNIWMGEFQKPRDPVLFEMEEKEVLDIDYEWQFKLCEQYYKGLNGC